MYGGERTESNVLRGSLSFHYRKNPYLNVWVLCLNLCASVFIKLKEL